MIKFTNKTRVAGCTLPVMEYNVELHKDDAVSTIGRVFGTGREWWALATNGVRWTGFHESRGSAAAAILARRW